MFQIKVDSRQLDAFADKLAKAAGTVRPIIVEQMAVEAQNLTTNSFRRSKSPYDEKWPPRKARGKLGAKSAAGFSLGKTVDIGEGSAFVVKAKPKRKKAKPKPKRSPKAKSKKAPKPKSRKAKGPRGGKGVGVSPVLGIGGDGSASVKAKKKKAAGKRKRGKRKGSRKLLVQSGAMRNSIHVYNVADAFTVGFGVNYATYHQTGTKRGLPVRMLIPTASLGLPKKWKREFQHVIQDVLTEYFDG
jgi:phage gpG-like protein